VDNKSTKAIFAEYFLSGHLLHYIYNYLPLFRISKQKVPINNVKAETLIKSINKKAQKLKFDQSRFKRLLTNYINTQISEKKPTKSLKNFVQRYHENVEDGIHNIPNTLDKARDALSALIEVEIFTDAFTDVEQVYDAMVLLSDNVTDEIIAKFVQNWKEEAKRHKEEYKDSSFPTSNIFWVSRDFMETIDGVSRYRFREHFRIGEFKSAFAEVEGMLATSLLEGSSGMEALAASFWGDQNLTSVAYDLWLVSRSRNLSNHIRDFVNVALQRIAGWQFPEDWWTNFQLKESVRKDPKTGAETFRCLPDTYTTALCSLDLLKLSISEPMRQKGVLGVQWLLEKQNPDGSWSREHISKNGIVTKPDLFLTLLSLEAILRSGTENVNHSIELGLKWIIGQQNDLGMWDDDSFPFPFMTVLVLEFIQLKDFFPIKLDSYLSMSKNFLNRSVQFSLEENSNSHRLAIITAFQGIEAFLYSVLVYPSVNKKIFEEPDKTIGMRKALSKLQSYLQDRGEINRDKVILYRNSLDRLAYLRDQVVHKGIDISQTECRNLIDDTLKFVSKYSLKIFGFDVFA